MSIKKFKRIIKFTPAFDKRNPDPKKNYGIHGVNLGFYLKGDKGVIQFIIYTNWQLKHVQEEFDEKTDREFPHLFCHPLPANIGYHSPVPKYENQTILTEECEWTGGKCYYDESGLNAEPIYWKLVGEGEEVMWKELERYYKIWLEVER